MLFRSSLPFGVFSRSPEDTERQGCQLGRNFSNKPGSAPGALVLLSGSLGAGKTVWTRGFAQGLGIPAEVHSPTFTVMNVYKGTPQSLYHLDLYRLQCFEEVADLGLFEIIEDGHICVIEWADRVAPLAEWSHLAVHLETLAEDDSRRISWRWVKGPRS